MHFACAVGVQNLAENHRVAINNVRPVGRVVKVAASACHQARQPRSGPTLDRAQACGERSTAHLEADEIVHISVYVFGTIIYLGNTKIQHNLNDV